MKGSLKAIVIALSLILICSLLLEGSMLMMVFSSGSSRAYTRQSLDIESIKNILNMSSSGTPQSQQDLKTRFSRYSHVSYEGHQKTVTLFSADQYEELMQGHQKKTTEGLSYEAALYLLADTIRLYSSADRIVLSEMENGIYETLRMDYTDLPYTQARQAYMEALPAIFYITLFRISVLDGGLAYIGEDYQLEPVTEIGPLTQSKYVLLLDRSKSEEPLDRLQKVYDRYRWGRSFEGQLLIFNTGNGRLSVAEYEKETYLFPSEEIWEKEPWYNKDFAPETEKIVVSLYRVGEEECVSNSERIVLGEEVYSYVDALHAREFTVSASEELRRVEENEVLYCVYFNEQIIYFPADLPVFSDEETDYYCIVEYVQQNLSAGYPFTVLIPRKFVKMIYELYS